MNHSVNILNSIVKPARIFKVVDLDKIERGHELWSSLDHGIALGKCPGGAADLEASAQELIDHMSTDESSSPGYKDIFSAAPCART